MDEDVILHVEIEEFGDTMEAFIVQQSPDLNGTEILQLVFDSMPRFKFQLHWRDGTTIETLSVRKRNPDFHAKLHVAVTNALRAFIAKDFVAL